MSRTYSVTEPHPSVPKAGGYLSGGRGGAGNYKHYNPSQLSAGPDARGPASRIALDRSSSSKKRSYIPGGRGGAGNMFAARSSSTEETPMFQFDEELRRRAETQQQHCAPVYHVGRGGAANVAFAAEQPRAVRWGSTDSASSLASGRSREEGESHDAFFNKLARKLSRQ